MIEEQASGSGEEISIFHPPMIYWIAGYLRITLKPEYHIKRKANTANSGAVIKKLSIFLDKKITPMKDGK